MCVIHSRSVDMSCEMSAGLRNGTSAPPGGDTNITSGGTSTFKCDEAWVFQVKDDTHCKSVQHYKRLQSVLQNI